jgi:hypothetical protein
LAPSWLWTPKQWVWITGATGFAWFSYQLAMGRHILFKSFRLA